MLDVNLGVCATGLVVFQNNIRINTFTWFVCFFLWFFVLMVNAKVCHLFIR